MYTDQSLCTSINCLQNNHNWWLIYGMFLVQNVLHIYGNALFTKPKDQVGNVCNVKPCLRTEWHMK